jgi:bifunctional non-homologous end joining protein LigD
MDGATARSADLGEYRRKRNFAASSEPAGDGEDAKGKGRQRGRGDSKSSARHGTGARREASGKQALRFVVHEHHARRLHWDLRLEHDGALASWAVPNGIPQDPKHNRKAIHVEDHPLDYIDFAGTIPAGSYGAGEVSVWDSGTYECEKWREDKVIVVFAGERLRGRYALFQAGREEKEWLIHRMDPPFDPDAREMPDFVVPMLARLSTPPADEDEDWAYEVKWDGVRAIARSEPGRIHFVSRNGNDVTAAYPELRALNRALGSREAMLDGEIIAFDTNGRPSFEALAPRMHQRGESAIRRLMHSTPVTYVIFDLLWLDGHSLTDLPYSERRARLQDLDLNDEHWRTPPYHSGPGEGRALLHATRTQGLEGILAKRLDSRYVPGGRESTWLKLKHHRRQEVVICGWHEGKGARAARIGALDLGVYDEDDALRYAGQVGTGFDEAELDRLAALLAPLERDESPFTGRQPPRGIHFVAPELVCEVEFSEWTQAGQLRQASYKGLREDKPAEDVTRERIQTPAEIARGPETTAAMTKKQKSTKPKSTPVTTKSRSAKTRAKTQSKTKQKPIPTRSTAKSAAAKDSMDSSAKTKPRPNTSSASVPLSGARRVRGGIEIDVEDRTLKLTNLDKVMYPDTGFTKGEVIGYYSRVAPVLLPHLRDHPLTLKRYPDGVHEEYFYEKHCPAHRPDWVQTTAVWSERGDREVEYCTCQDLPTLVWLANLASIELHPSLSRAQSLDRPTAIAFDLDPGAPAGLLECCEVSLLIRDMLSELGLISLAKTSGSKGLQVYVPLNNDTTNSDKDRGGKNKYQDKGKSKSKDRGRDKGKSNSGKDKGGNGNGRSAKNSDDGGATYDQTKPFARAIAEALASRLPKLVTSTMTKSRRPGRVLIDWSQNDEHKTTVSVYSLRAGPSPTVSAPLDWREVEKSLNAGDPEPLQLGPDEVLKRADKRSDLFAQAVTLRQELPELGR